MAATVDEEPESGHEYGGRVPGLAGQPAFELMRPRPSAMPVVIAVPHAGRFYPPDLVTRMRNPDDSCLRLEDRYADLLAREVARMTGAALLVAHAPRAMIDLNRAPDDMDWEMVSGASGGPHPPLAAGRRARSGLGLVPRRLPGTGELWRRKLVADELEKRIEQVHRPYHQALSLTLERLRDRWGSALLIDLHSMPPLSSRNGTDPAADFVIGDRYGSSCMAQLSAAALDHFGQAGWPVAHNRPYAGGYVLDRHSSPARGLHALQLETCRAAYLNRALSEPGDGMARVIDVIAGLVRRMAEELSAASRMQSQAAE